jgi:hypothetical protein
MKVKNPKIAGHVGWMSNEEKLLALIVPDDEVASRLTDCGGEGFFRAFIVQNRATGQIMMRHRFRFSVREDLEVIEP